MRSVDREAALEVGGDRLLQLVCELLDAFGTRARLVGNRSVGRQTQLAGARGEPRRKELHSLASVVHQRVTAARKLPVPTRERIDRRATGANPAEQAVPLREGPRVRTPCLTSRRPDRSGHLVEMCAPKA